MRKNFLSSKRLYLMIAGICIIAIIVFAVAKNNTLSANDKIALEFIEDFAYEFKDPSSVRLVSGTVDFPDDLPCLWCGLSATNGFGARTTSYYFFRTYGNGTVGVTESSYGLTNPSFTEKDKLNIDLINKKLEQIFGSYE